MSTTAEGGYTNDHAAMDTLAAALVNLLANELEYTRYGYVAVDAAGSGDLTLDADTEEPYSILYVTGVLTGARNLIVSDDAGRRWVIINATSGAYALTVKTSGGTGIAVTQGYTALLGGDGTNILRLTPDVTNGGAAALAGLALGGALTSPVTTAQDLTNSATITLPTTGTNKEVTASGGSVTGVILTAGAAGQEITLINTEASNTITFAAAGTSNVADGTSAVIPALRAITFKWSSSTSRWFRTG